MLSLICGTILIVGQPVQATVLKGGVSTTNRDKKIFLRFRATLDSDVNSRDAIVGDIIKGHLPHAIKLADRTIVPAQSHLLGHVEAVARGRNLIGRMISHDDGLHGHGYLVVEFDRIVMPNGHELMIRGLSVKQHEIYGTEAGFKEIDVGDGGMIEKASSLDMWQDSDFGIVIPESILQIGRRLEVHLKEGDRLDIRAEVDPAELAAVAPDHAL